jgi:UV DNA damage endonuclease
VAQRAKTIRKSEAPFPNLGLVCITHSGEIRYRTITRTRYLSFQTAQRQDVLRELFSSNLKMFEKALRFCERRQIHLYRMPSSIFPFADTPEGLAILEEFAETLRSLGTLAQQLKIRVVAHPDQFVVLSSESQQVIDNSIKVLQMHADIFDLMGLSQSPFNAFIVHGGKRGNRAVLVRTINELPNSIRTRLTLENDEISYSSAEITAICKQLGICMIFDAHHHLILEKCSGYNDLSIQSALMAARSTWHPNEEWQLVHISNGSGNSHDRRHSDFITEMPDCYADVSWIEVEARAKELAIEKIRSDWRIAR